MAFDGTRLVHAYGLATDTDQLLGLLDDDKDAANYYLYSAIVHQGTPWTATAPVTSLLVSCLDCPDARSARADILKLVAHVAETLRVSQSKRLTRDEIAVELDAFGPDVARRWDEVLAEAAEDEEAFEEAYDDEDLTDYILMSTYLTICDAMPSWGEAAAQLVADDDPGVAAAALHAGLACGRTDLDVELFARAQTGTVAQRAAAVDLLGMFGRDVSAYLDDEALGVRVCAAFAPALADDPHADAVLLAAMSDPAAVDAALPDGSHQLPVKPSMGLCRRTAASRSAAKADLVDVALAVARAHPTAPADWCWGQFLVPIMAGATVGEQLDPDQRRFLAGLVAITDAWDPTMGNNSNAFCEARLPYDPAQCSQLADGAPLFAV